MRILIVQSNEALGQIWKAHLERLGANVVLSVEGSDAISKLETVSFDAIVLDLVLKDAGALSVADMAYFRQPNANVIFVTDTTFFSDGSIFSHSRNARALIQSETPPSDLAQIVYHYGQETSRVGAARDSQAMG